MQLYLLGLLAKSYRIKSDTICLRCTSKIDNAVPTVLIFKSRYPLFQRVCNTSHTVGVVVVWGCNIIYSIYGVQDPRLVEFQLLSYFYSDGQAGKSNLDITLEMYENNKSYIQAGEELLSRRPNFSAIASNSIRHPLEG